MAVQRGVKGMLRSSGLGGEPVAPVRSATRSATDLVRYAEGVFGNPQKAQNWLSQPKTFLDGHTPLGVIDTSGGREQIEQMLVRIEHGMIG